MADARRTGKHQVLVDADELSALRRDRVVLDALERERRRLKPDEPSWRERIGELIDLRASINDTIEAAARRHEARDEPSPQPARGRPEPPKAACRSDVRRPA